MKNHANQKDSSDPAGLAQVETPFLALDAVRMQRNIVRLRERMGRLGGGLRPHLKTGKSAEVARRMFDGGVGPATVSTLREAEYFADAGFTDMLYAVGIGAATAMLQTILADYPANTSRGKATALVGTLNGLGVVILSVGLGRLMKAFVSRG